MLKQCSPSPVCHVTHISCVICHVSGVRCHMSGLTSNFQNIKNRELQFREKVHLLPHVTCQLSHVMSLFFFLPSVEFSQWRVCYQQGLPRLVFLLAACVLLQLSNAATYLVCTSGISIPLMLLLCLVTPVPGPGVWIRGHS